MLKSFATAIAVVIVLFVCSLAYAQGTDAEFLDPASNLVASGSLGALFAALQVYGVYLYKQKAKIAQIDTWREVKLLVVAAIPTGLAAWVVLSQLDGPVPVWQRVIVCVAVAFMASLKANSAAIGEGDGSGEQPADGPADEG